MIPLLVIYSALAFQEPSAERVYEATTPSILTLSIVREHGETSVGTAFLALRKGVAVTAWHVLKGAKSVTAKFSDGHEVPVKTIIDKDARLDLALLEVDCGERPCLSLAELDPKVGSKAFVIGSPRGMDFSISDGIISQTPYFGDSKLYQFTCPVSPGNSGGPLLNTTGQVMGIVSWQLRDAQNLNFAVPVAGLKSLDLTKSGASLAQIAEEKTPPTGKIEAISDAVIQEAIRFSDLTSKTADDGTGLNSFLIDCEGSKVMLFQYAKDGRPGSSANLSINSGFEGTAGPDLKRLNEFNRCHRFVRCYRDSGGAIYVENDLDVENGIGFHTLVRFVSDFAKVLSLFESEVIAGGTPSQVSQQVKLTEPGIGIDDPAIASLLTQRGLKFQSADDGTGKTRYSFKSSGLEVTLFQFADDGRSGPTTSLTLSVGLELDHPVDLSLVNRYNERSRYLKAFADTGKLVYLVSDLDVVGGVTLESIGAFVDRFVGACQPFADCFSPGQ